MRLRRVLPLALLALAACPSVDRQDPPASIAVATFDPNTSTIPLPNDLALQRAPGLPAGLQRELLGSFVANGGWPADQEVAVTIPITVKARQPDGTYGTPCPGVPASRCGTAPAGLDLATVSDDNVALVRIDSGSPQRVTRCAATPVTAECFEPAYANGVLTLRRASPDGSRRWPAGARYVVALRANGIRTSDGLAIGADSAIALVAQNKDLANRENQPPGGLPDSNGNGTNADETATIEALRGTLATPRAWGTVTNPATCQAALGAPVPVPLCWLPAPSTTLPSALAAVASVFPADQIASIQTFTVQSLAAPRPLTDSGSGTIPLPSDFLLGPDPADPTNPAKRKVRLVEAFGPAAAGLATLDGFSTTAPLLIPLTGPSGFALDPTTVVRNNVRLYKVANIVNGAPSPIAPQWLNDIPSGLGSGQQPQIVTTTSGTTIVLAPATRVEQGPPVPVNVPPLDEKAQYLVVVTKDVKDAAGNSLRRSTLMDIVLTFTSPIVNGAGVSQIPGVSNADAAGLAQLRTALTGLFAATGITASDVVLAYTVRTQSVKDVTKLLSAAPYGIEQAATAAVFSPIAAAGAPDFDIGSLGLTFDATNFPNVAKFVQATIPTVYAIDGTTGAFDPAFATWTAAQVQQHIRPIPALVAVPKLAVSCTPSAPCPAPLVVFTHGINGARWQMIPVADALAARGFAVAAIDMPYFGERALCSANSDCVVAGGADGVCTPNAALQTPADPTAPGTCTTGTPKPNPARLSTVSSGKFFITANFFRIRDGLRQYVLDQSALVLALARPPAGAYPLQPAANPLRDALLAQGVVVNPTQVYFAGVSLGAMIGTSSVATNPRFSRAAMNVPGGTLVDVFTTSPSFQAGLAPVFAPLGIDLACVQAGTGCDAATRAAQTARFAQTLALAKWILDPADPLNYAANLAPTAQKTFDPALQPFVTAGLGSATTAAYGQMVTNDRTVPNLTNRLYLGVGSIPATTYTSASRDPLATGGVGVSLHELLYSDFPPGAPSTTTAGGIVRDDLAAFLATGTATAGPKNVP